MSVLFRRPSLRAGPVIVPTEPVEIDWEHPLAAGLVALYVPGGAHGFADLTGVGAPLIPGDTLGAVQGTVQGPGYYEPSSGGLLTTTVFPTKWQFTDRFSVVFISSQLGTPGKYTMLFGCDYIGNPGPYVPYGIVDQLGPAFFYSDGSSYTYFNGASYPIGPFQISASVVVGGAIDLYQQGALAASSTWSLGTPNYSSPALPYLAMGSDLSTRGLNGVALKGAFYARILSADEHAWLAAEPFAMLRPKVRRRYYLVSGGNVYNETISEGASATDNYTASATMRPSITEAASGADAWSATAVFNAADAESASATDAYAAVMSAVVAFTESGSASDALAVATAFVAAVGETGTAADAWTVANVIAEALAESGAATDAVSAVATMNATLAEAASAVDNYAIPGTNTFIQLVARMAQTPRAPHGFV